MTGLTGWRGEAHRERCLGKTPTATPSLLLAQWSHVMLLNFSTSASRFAMVGGKLEAASSASGGKEQVLHSQAWLHR